MKRTFTQLGIVTAFLALASLPVRAELHRGDQFGLLSGGLSFPMGELEDFGRRGSLLNVSYRYHWVPAWSFGVDAGFFNFGNRDVSHLVTYDVGVFSLGALFRHDFSPEKETHPYVRGGPTINFFDKKITDASGLDETSVSRGGAFLAGGYDWEVQNFWIWGVEGRYDYWGSEGGALSVLLRFTFRIG